MTSQQRQDQNVQNDQYTNLDPKEKPASQPRDPVRNPKQADPGVLKPLTN